MAKLTNEEKITLAKYRIERARNTYIEAVDNAGMGHWNLVANRLYYSVFHALNALIVIDGDVVRTHKGLISVIGLHYVTTGEIKTEDNKLIMRLFRMRQTADYDDYCDWDEQDVSPLVEKVKSLLDKIELILNRKITQL